MTPRKKFGACFKFQPMWKNKYPTAPVLVLNGSYMEGPHQMLLGGPRNLFPWTAQTRQNTCACVWARWMNSPAIKFIAVKGSSRSARYMNVIIPIMCTTFVHARHWNPKALHHGFHCLAWCGKRTAGLGLLRPCTLPKRIWVKVTPK